MLTLLLEEEEESLDTTLAGESRSLPPPLLMVSSFYSRGICNLIIIFAKTLYFYYLSQVVATLSV